MSKPKLVIAILLRLEPTKNPTYLLLLPKAALKTRPMEDLEDGSPVFFFSELLVSFCMNLDMLDVLGFF